MSIDLIEAAWSDPILRSELLAIEQTEIPQHPAGDVTSPAAGAIVAQEKGGCYDAGSEIIYYTISYFTRPMCCA